MTTEIQKPYDNEIKLIAEYVDQIVIDSDLAYETAYYDLLDTLGCGLLALNFPECTRVLGPVVPGATLTKGARVPGTDYQLDPVQAAFNIGAMNRWLDFNDTWLAAEWGHPSDNLAAILAVADFLNRTHNKHFTVNDVLTALIKAVEIQGVIALQNSFNRVGLDHVVLVKVASTAVVTKMLGGNFEQICAALSQAWIDGQSLRTYRHAPNTGSRKSWAAGDAASRAVRLSLMTMAGEMGYPTALTAKTWGFYDVSFAGKPLVFERPLGSYVMENILFKISFPAEFHGQTAVEAALELQPQVKDRLDQIEKITIRTQESANRIINKTGPLNNPADRDHCIQYMTAIGLIYGELNSEYYQAETAKNPLINQIREKMQVIEDKKFSQDYLDPDKRSITNAVQVFFQDGSKTEEVVVEYPIGHRRRRKEGIPKLMEKFDSNLKSRFQVNKVKKILAIIQDHHKLKQQPIDQFISLLIT